MSAILRCVRANAGRFPEATYSDRIQVIENFIQSAIESKV